MDFSTFSKNFFVEQNTIKQIDSHHRFIGELFFAGGSDFFSDKIIYRDTPKYWTARSLFNGKRKLTVEIRDSFPQKFDEKRFVTYFKDRISAQSVKKIAKKFDILSDEVNKDFLLMALCKQFMVIIYDVYDSEDQNLNIV